MGPGGNLRESRFSRILENYVQEEQDGPGGGSNRS